MNRSNFLIGCGTCLASIGLFALSFGYRDLNGGLGDPGTVFVPRIILGLIFIVGLFACISAFQSKDTDASKKKSDHNDDVVPGVTRAAMIAAAATALYLFAFREGFYFWATPVYLAFTLWLAGMRRWITILSVSLGFLLIAYFGFYLLLGVPLLSV